MTRSKLLVVASVVFVALLGPEPAYSQPASRPMGGMMRGRMTERMQQMGMNHEMMLRARMLMRAQLSRFNPSSLLALRDELKITEDQADKLQTIVKEAREKARAVLTPAQLAEVEKLPKTPVSGMAMHQKMMQMMKGKGMAGEMKCPMMEMGAATKPAGE